MLKINYEEENIVDIIDFDLPIEYMPFFKKGNHIEIAEEIKYLDCCSVIIKKERLLDELYEDPGYAHKEYYVSLSELESETRKRMMNKYMTQEDLNNLFEKNNYPIKRYNYKEEDKRSIKYEIEDSILKAQEMMLYPEVIEYLLRDCDYILNDEGYIKEFDYNFKLDSNTTEIEQVIINLLKPECTNDSDSIEYTLHTKEQKNSLIISLTAKLNGFDCKEKYYKKTFKYKSKNFSDTFKKSKIFYEIKDIIDNNMVKADEITRQRQREKRLFEICLPQIRVDYTRLWAMSQPFNNWDDRNYEQQFFLVKFKDYIGWIKGGQGSSNQREEKGRWSHVFATLTKHHYKIIPTYIFTYNKENNLIFDKKYDTFKLNSWNIRGNYGADYTESKSLMEDLFLDEDGD